MEEIFLPLILMMGREDLADFDDYYLHLQITNVQSLKHLGQLRRSFVLNLAERDG